MLINRRLFWPLMIFHVMEAKQGGRWVQPPAWSSLLCLVSVR